MLCQSILTIYIAIGSFLIHQLFTQSDHKGAAQAVVSANTGRGAIAAARRSRSLCHIDFFTLRSKKRPKRLLRLLQFWRIFRVRDWQFEPVR
jgi:hypothetical protein